MLNPLSGEYSRREASRYIGLRPIFLPVPISFICPMGADHKLKKYYIWSSLMRKAVFSIILLQCSLVYTDTTVVALDAVHHSFGSMGNKRTVIDTIQFPDSNIQYSDIIMHLSAGGAWKNRDFCWMCHFSAFFLVRARDFFQGGDGEFFAWIDSCTCVSWLTHNSHTCVN